MATFDKSLVDEIEATEEIEVETHRDGKAQRTVVWVVTDSGHVYLRSVRATAGKWWQRMPTDSDPAIHVGGRRTRVKPISVTDRGEIDRVSQAFLRKYASSEWAPPMVKPETLPTTLRLEPA